MAEDAPARVARKLGAGEHASDGLPQTPPTADGAWNPSIRCGTAGGDTMVAADTVAPCCPTPYIIVIKGAVGPCAGSGSPSLACSLARPYLPPRTKKRRPRAPLKFGGETSCGCGQAAIRFENIGCPSLESSLGVAGVFAVRRRKAAG